MNESPPSYVRSIDLLSRDDSRLLIVDMQERLLPAIFDADAITAACVKLVQGAKLLGIPVFATEQYPRGLGSTVPELADLIAKRPEKTRFSCAEVLNWGTAAEPTDPELADRSRVIVAGIEAHVCVLQTVFDLLAVGFHVYVAADAVSSRTTEDRRLALDRMSGGGAVITSTESILFEWCETADDEQFKPISKLVTGR